ncbi:helix-turn-helix domain-containing protein [Citrobacter portucalensis]|uniref:helix-turn-helix domain-containing protein n=1 Tax=Citrobacter portucalensis TaxID=1639133 RepID=UPI00226B9E41|nr:helix-turn-helix domain-containing protein [Citrobacter portucalensis]MCX8984458.1 helix-turn-helix domain-containing protein [Citrobacter portucalensis]
MEQASDSLKLLRSQTAKPIARQAHITCHLTDEDKDHIIKQVEAGHTATSICNANHIDYNTLRQLKAEHGLPNVQRQHIRKFTTDELYSALSTTKGNGKAAAAMLGVHPRTIDRRLKLNP